MKKIILPALSIVFQLFAFYSLVQNNSDTAKGPILAMESIIDNPGTN